MALENIIGGVLGRVQHFHLTPPLPPAEPFRGQHMLVLCMWWQRRMWQGHCSGSGTGATVADSVWRG